ncbi:HAMP domain-containing sensor histidine kinase [Saccharibacillus sp. JS10]|uniref:sensor histidine kinase n=1 Tax=Saccharibacillus sp. JS10 TaxID=2950552 RepID=UPI00210D7C29|nr:HAMP domain-containing histidine kinase [Saccharibacillus sp. JS10]
MASLSGSRRSEPERKVKSLKVWIGQAFRRTLLLSILATLLTWAVGFVLLIVFGSVLRPANYYENQIPEIVSRLQTVENVVAPTSRSAVEKIVPGEGIGYAVYNIFGEQVYGSFELSEPMRIEGTADLLKRLNRQVPSDGYYVRYEPLTEADGRFVGAIALRYKLTVAASNPSWSIPVLFGGLLMAAAPFLYLYRFAMQGGRKLSRRLEQPFARLIEGAEKIREHDLDFSLERGGTRVRELNQLLAAFEQMREALEEALRREWESERERRDMIAAVAHDLGTPLSVIRGHAELLIEVNARHPERATRYAQTILGAVDRSIRLTADLSEAANVERPDFILYPESVDLEAIVRAKAREYAFLCRRSGVAFEVNICDRREEGKRSLLWLDQNQINRVLDNLIGNALRYSPEGGKIQLVLDIHSGEAEFEVRDEGQGFAEAEAGRIFEKFYREDASRSSDARLNDGAHSGLGLFIARTIVRRHGGEIAARNLPNRGAAVRFSVAELDAESHGNKQD